MKTRIFIACALLAALNSFAIAGARPAEAEKDSIILTFGNKTRLIIYGESREELDKVMKYDLNALLRDLKTKLDSSGRDTTFLAEEIDGKKYRTNQNDSDYVRIGLRGVHVKEGTTEVKIDADGVSVKDDTDNDSEYRRTGANSGPGKKFYRSSPGSSPRKGFTFALGLNAYGKNETTTGYNKESYDLKPFGSRYISLGYIASTRIARGKNASLHLDFGADFSWYNLMFDGNNTVKKDSGFVYFDPLRDTNGDEIQLKKSKLVVPNVNLSLMPTLSFRRSFISHLSAGVYGGYRLGSYTKTQAEGSKDKDHVRTNFYVSDFRYGLAAEIGFRNFVDLFVNYDLNNLYEDGRGPKIRMISFGIRL